MMTGARWGFSAIVDYRLILRMLAVRDKSFFTAVEGDEAANLAASGLTVKQAALVRVAALVALDAAPASYAHAVDVAGAAGATAEEIVQQRDIRRIGPTGFEIRSRDAIVRVPDLRSRIHDWRVSLSGEQRVR